LLAAPSADDQWMLAKVAGEEIDHFRKINRLLNELGEDASELMYVEKSRRDLEAFRQAMPTWADVAAFGFLIDRVGQYQLEEFVGGSYLPLDRALPRILMEEKTHVGYGHVKLRDMVRTEEGRAAAQSAIDPTRFLLSRSLARALVERGDVIEFDLEGKAVGGDARPPYLERFIHGAIYEARPEVQAVVHAHAEAVLPFTISTTPLRPVVHMASFMGPRIPVWDIRDHFGDTNLLVVNMAQGRDLARGLGVERVVLMRGHGFSAAGRSLPEAIRIAVYLPLNARVLSEAMRLGEVKALSRGEIEAHA